MAKAKHNGHLQLDPKNARKHSPRNQALIRQSLETVGAGRSILADANGIVRAGNGVFEQAQALGIPVKVVESDGHQLIAVKRTDLKGKAAVRAAMLDNLAADSSYADYDADILASIAKDDELIASLAREDKAIAALLAKAEPQAEKVDAGELLDKATELQKKWKVARGDIFAVGRHRVMCGDSTSKADVARLMDGKRAQLVVTSPPYPGAEMWQTEGEKLVAVGNAVLEGLPTLLDSGAVVCWNTSDIATGNGGVVPNVARDTLKAISIGLVKRGEIIWEKGVSYLTPPPFTRRPVIPNSLTESILMFVNGKWQPRDKSGLLNDEQMLWQRENVWKMHTESAKKMGHKAPFPTELASRCIQLWSLEADTVFDPFLGSGTTLVACEQTGRIGYGMEIEPKYCAVTLERLANLGLTPRPVRMGDGKAR